MIISVRKAGVNRRTLTKADRPVVDPSYALVLDPMRPTIKSSVFGINGDEYSINFTRADIDALSKALTAWEKEFARYEEKPQE